MKALVLLLVFAHAVLAGTTHFHRVSRQGADPAAAARRDEADDGPAAKGHLQCVLCRLQRQFDSGHRPSAPKLAVPTTAAQDPEGHSPAATASAPPLLKQGRAPPLS